MTRQQRTADIERAAGYAAGQFIEPPVESLDATPTSYTLIFMALIFMCMGAAGVIGWHVLGWIGR